MTRNVSRNSVAARFAARLKEAQVAVAVTNEQLARDLDVSLRLVQTWRAGKTVPSQDSLAKLEGRFGLSASQLFSDEPLPAVAA